MTRWLHEYWIAAALFAVAAVVPLVWASVDSQRRLELKQTAWVTCWSHQGRKLADCERLRPEVLPDGTEIICDMTGHASRDCWDLVHGGGR